MKNSTLSVSLCLLLLTAAPPRDDRASDTHAARQTPVQSASDSLAANTQSTVRALLSGVGLLAMLDTPAPRSAQADWTTSSRVTVVASNSHKQP